VAVKFLFKWALRLFLLAVVLVVILALSKDWLIKTAARRSIASATGMATHIGSLQVGVESPVIDLRDLKLDNPAEFGGAPFVDLPELHVEYDPVALGAGKLRIKLLRLNLAELNLVRNAAGQTNLNVLQTRLQPSSNTPTGLKYGGFTFEQIDVLNLTLGKFRYTDLANPANNREVDLGVQNEIFQNIKSEGDLYGVVMVLMLKHGSAMDRQLFGNPAR
jgi:uncharacterized protein involved in outer membrane biogenesis